MTEPGPRADGGVAPVARKAAELRRLELLVTRRLDGLLRGEFLYYSLNNSPSVVVTPAIHVPSGYSWSNTNVSVARAAVSYKF